MTWEQMLEALLWLALSDIFLLYYPMVPFISNILAKPCGSLCFTIIQGLRRMVLRDGCYGSCYSFPYVLCV